MSGSGTAHLTPGLGHSAIDLYYAVLLLGRAADLLVALGAVGLIGCHGFAALALLAVVGMLPVLLLLGGLGTVLVVRVGAVFSAVVEKRGHALVCEFTLEL